MNNLPDTSGKTPATPTSFVTMGIGKESEAISLSDSESGLQDAGAEIELPKEVSAIGVTQKSTVIPIPQPVSQLGVKPTGSNIPTQTKTTFVTPLSDSELAEGLHISVINSFRWLAEWCRKQLKVLNVMK
jgi:hypothetical protein